MRYKFAVVIVLICSGSVTGQTASEFEMKYGKPVITYLVSEHIWMTPEYTSDGQVCLMRLHPRHFAPNTNYVSPSLPFQELMRVLNRLVPVQIRGSKKEPFDVGAAGGKVEWMTYAYEKVQFTFVSPFDPEAWKTRKEYVFTVQPGTAQPKPKSSPPAENDFSSSQSLSIELVTINWTNRQCAKQ